MKTNVIEIFQTIRAVMQPYEAQGFATHMCSDTEYELRSEKLIVLDSGEKTQMYFAGLRILENTVVFNLSPMNISANDQPVLSDEVANLFTRIAKFKVTALDETLLEKITAALARGFKIYKQQGWV